MKKLLWKILKLVDDNWGYESPHQERFEIGDEVRLSLFLLPEEKFGIGDIVTIIETGRYDYLIKHKKSGKLKCVYQQELDKKLKL